MSEGLANPIGNFRPKNIVLATDFLESSRLALDYAVAFAHRFGATLTIVHALELSFEAEEAETRWQKSSVSRTLAHARLEGLAAGVRRTGISVRIDLREGEPVGAILKSTIDHKCDLLVLGTHGIYRGVQHIVIGSNAEKILLSTECPTLTVGRHVLAGIDLDLKITDLLVVTDVNCGSLSPLLLGLKLGIEFGVPIDLMYVRSEGDVEDAQLGGRLSSRCQDTLQRFPALADPRLSSPDFHRERIFNARDVIRRVESSASRLIVTGVQPMSSIERHLYGSFAFQLAARAVSPLVSVPCGNGDAS